MNSDMWNHESRAADNGRECYKCFGVESLYHDDDCNYDGNSLCYVVPYIILCMLYVNVLHQETKRGIGYVFVWERAKQLYSL